MLRRTPMVALTALAVTGDAQMLRGIFMSSESSWQPDLDGQMHHETHEVQTEMVRHGNVMQETRSTLDCMHGLCRKMVHISDPSHVVNGYLPRFVRGMLQRLRSGPSSEDADYAPKQAEFDGGFRGGPVPPAPWFHQGPPPKYSRPMPEMTPGMPNVPGMPQMRGMPHMPEMMPWMVEAPPRFVDPDPTIGMVPFMRVEIDEPEPVIVELAPPPARTGFFGKVSKALKAARPGDEPVAPLAALAAFGVLTMSALIVATASCRCLRADSRELPLSVALGQPLAPESEVHHVVAAPMPGSLAAKTEEAAFAVADAMATATAAYLVRVYERAATA